VGELGQKRRRLRERRRVREALLLDLGALVYELHRQGKRAPELLQQKAAELTVIDDEVRELEEALDGGTPHETERAEPQLGDPELGDPELGDPATDEVDAAELEAALAEGDVADEPGAADQLTDDEPALAEHEERHA
jgi:hypothetical protein